MTLSRAKPNIATICILHYITQSTTHTNIVTVNWYILRTRLSQLLKQNVHRPGIEPGPPAWQASILPLNHRCERLRNLPLHVLRIPVHYYRPLPFTNLPFPVLLLWRTEAHDSHGKWVGHKISGANGGGGQQGGRRPPQDFQNDIFFNFIGFIDSMCHMYRHVKL